jgi:two-component sensor histidine kinase
MSRPLHSRAVLVETVQPDDGTEGGGIRPFASRFEMMAARSAAMSPRLGQMLGVLLDAARPSHCGGRAVLRPLWAEEAMHRACNMLVLVMQLHQMAGVRPEDNVALRLDRGVAGDLAALFRTLEIRKEGEEVPCSCVLRGVIRNLVALFASGAGPVVIRTDIEPLSLPAYKRRALVLAASELVINALRHGFAGGCGGLIQVTLRAFGTAHACLTVVDDGVGFHESRLSGQRGIASDLADLLEADLVYRRLGIAGTNAEIVFPTSQRIWAVGLECLAAGDRSSGLRGSAVAQHRPRRDLGGISPASYSAMPQEL